MAKRVSELPITTHTNLTPSACLLVNEPTNNGFITKQMTIAELNNELIENYHYLTSNNDNDNLTNESKINTLIGNDTNKSVRTIANEELVTQLIPANASAALDTLQEIAAWIQAHPNDVAQINSTIAALQQKLTLGVNSNNNEYSTVKDYVEATIANENSNLQPLTKEDIHEAFYGFKEIEINTI